jgi:hypothetical protein
MLSVYAEAHVAACCLLLLHLQGQLALEDVQARVAQFVAAGLPLLVTSATLLVDKAQLLPGSTFVVSAAAHEQGSVRVLMFAYLDCCWTSCLAGAVTRAVGVQACGMQLVTALCNIR